MSMDKPTHRIAEEAAEYLVHRPVETLAERRQREAWLAENAAHAREYETMQRVWDGMEGLRDDPELQALQAADLAAVQRRARWMRAGRTQALAATFLLLLCMGYLAMMHAFSPASPAPEPRYLTDLGERRTEVLPDGTQVILNTDTAVETRYTRGRREIRLARGEAQFDVAHDARRPFVVHVGGSSVTALGTRFQIRSDADAATVTLLDGEVEVAHGGERRVMHPNQQARLLGRAGIEVRPVDPDQAADWLEGWLRFQEAPLGHVVAEANRYSSRKLRLGDPALAGLALSGNFHAGDSASIAASIALLLPVRVDDGGDDIVLLPQ
ncbi:FecR domain-containing protein [Luteimonas sp. XNQY3]|nr:FecR domain-containing protein [Luteimonas sp. XNQY3]MCD9008254.1 FecR domain-containing protein [Luteimonas sp. XNQY3]